MDDKSTNPQIEYQWSSCIYIVGMNITSYLMLYNTVFVV